MDSRLQAPAQAMRLAIGLMATLAGIDKFFDMLVDWGSYVSPVTAQLLPFSTDVFMWIVGVIEVVVGLSILTALPVVGAYVASAWLLVVAVNLSLGGYFDVAVRDVVLSIAAFTLARLIQVRDQVDVGDARPAPVRHHRIA
jgi:uncharacterized membrane protein YphA (DoxX/SURF4 family)